MPSRLKLLICLGTLTLVGIAVFVLQQPTPVVVSKDQVASRESTTRESTTSSSDASPLSPAPGLENAPLIAPLADSYRRIDPTEDGWQSETFSAAATAQLAVLATLLENDIDVDSHPGSLTELAAAEFSAGSLRPDSLETVFDDGVVVVSRAVTIPDMRRRNMTEALRDFSNALRGATHRHAKFKLVHVEPKENSVSTRVLVSASGETADGTKQINANWHCGWIIRESGSPQLTSIQVEDHEESVYRGVPKTMFSDCTESVLGLNDSYQKQLAYSTDHWRSRLARDLGLDVVANHGLAIGDVNGDGLDDIYICQQGGLPNRLYLRNEDGTLTDGSRDGGTDWLEYCASALLVDLDNDGDRDLVVAQEWRVLMMSNDGKGHFQLEFGLSTNAQAFSLSASDYDQDGDLDIFVCGYNSSRQGVRNGAMGEPMPYHDANNGGPNMLLANIGNWEFEDVVSEVGLNENNTRFSFAASWEDFDNDGDFDLYVANDYGRNNLYRNEGGHFHDVAAELGVEDMSAGMSASWADFNRDGWMDLYVSNMFSAAGNRITYQRQFKAEVDEETRRQFQRHARGNSLFENTQNGFRDVSVSSATTMGRWAWGSTFGDLNNDGWEDLVVANGFITATDTDDL